MKSISKKVIPMFLIVAMLVTVFSFQVAFAATGTTSGGKDGNKTVITHTITKGADYNGGSLYDTATLKMTASPGNLINMSHGVGTFTNKSGVTGNISANSSSGTVNSFSSKRFCAAQGKTYSAEFKALKATSSVFGTFTKTSFAKVF